MVGKMGVKPLSSIKSATLRAVISMFSKRLNRSQSHSQQVLSSSASWTPCDSDLSFRYCHRLNQTMTWTRTRNFVYPEIPGTGRSWHPLESFVGSYVEASIR